MSSKSPNYSTDPQSNYPFMPHSLPPTHVRKKELLTRINARLSRASNRLEGLEMLNMIIISCSPVEVSANYTTWLTHCCPQPRDDFKEIKLRVIRKIIIVSCNLQDFNRKFVIDYIAKVVDVCISTHVDLLEMDTALETLSVCMKHYGSWFTTHRQKIEKYLVTFLDNRSKKVVRSAAEAFLYLQQTGGAGAEGINHAQNFSSSFSKLCITTHNLFDAFFEDETNIKNYTSEEDEGFTFKDPSASFELTAQRIQNISMFLQIMMLKGFPVVKEIKPIDVINIVERGMHVHICCESEKSYQSASLLIKIQISLLRLMQTFLIWSGTNSLPFSHKITKTLIDCLEMSQKCHCFTVDSDFQRTTYSSLNTWMAIVRCGFHENFQTKLIGCILKDISPIKNQITLTVSSDAKKKSGKAKKKAVQGSVISTGLVQTSILRPNEKLLKFKTCCHSLETLKQMLNHTDLRVDKSKLKELYHVIFEAFDSIVTSTEIFPYTDPQCQIKLFELLPAFYEQGLSTSIPPLQHTLSILNKGLNNDIFQVSDACEKGINMLEKICQPVCPSLHILDIGSKTSEKIIIDGNDEEKEVVTDAESPILNDEDALLSKCNGDEDEIILNEFGVTNIILFEPNDASKPVVEHDSQKQETSKVNILDVQVIIDEPEHDQLYEATEADISTVNDECNQAGEPTEASDVMTETDTLNLEDEPPSKFPKLDVEPTEEPFEDDSFVDVINPY